LTYEKGSKNWHIISPNGQFINIMYRRVLCCLAPEEPYYVRPASPYANAVWIDGEWVWRGGRYAYIGGHWDRPLNGRVWVRGNWQSSTRGYTWHRGYWR
jgi:hypothetical protein